MKFIVKKNKNLLDSTSISLVHFFENYLTFSILFELFHEFSYFYVFFFSFFFFKLNFINKLLRGY